MPATQAVVRKRKDFFFAESGVGKRQSAFDVAMSNADLDTRTQLTEPSEPTTERTRETIYDCDGVHIVKEEINSQLDRWIVSYPATAQQITKRLAFAKGTAAAPTGTPADEVQEIDLGGATGGDFTHGFDFEGKDDTTPDLDPLTLTAAQYQAALEELKSIGEGNVTVTGAVGGPFEITYIGRLAKANMPLPTITDSTTGGTGVVATQTTAGANKYHLITRASSDVLAKFSFYTGFQAVAATYEKRKNAFINRVTITIPRRRLATVETEIIASSDTEFDPTFVVPACVIPEPVKAADCRFQWDGDWVTGDVEQVIYELNNGFAGDDDDFPTDGIDLGDGERAERPTETLRIQIQGSKQDAFYQDCRAELEKPAVLYIGRPGERAVITLPLVSGKLDSGLTFNAKGKSVINATAQPHKDNTLQTYSKVEYFGAQTAQFLST